MHGRTHSHFDGFQIEPPCFTATSEDRTHKVLYFTRDFLTDRFGRFFSWADSGFSSTGLNPQICSLTSNNCPPNARKRWYSVTSRWALAKLAGEDKVSVTVLPSTLRVNR